MSEKDYLENALSLTKCLCTLELNGSIEASNNKVKSYMTSALLVNLELQESLYDTMSDIGYYKVDKVKKDDIKKLYKKLTENE